MNGWAVFFTVISGTLVYVIGQIVSKFVIDPIYELKKSIGEVRFYLSLYACQIHTPAARKAELSAKARDALLKSSSDLLSKLHAVIHCDAITFVVNKVIPDRQSIESAAVNLRGLSTYVLDQEATDSDLETIARKVKKIEDLLRLKPLE